MARYGNERPIHGRQVRRGRHRDGIAGLTASHHAALEGASVGHLAGSGVPGGLVANVGEIEGFPAVGPMAAIDLAMRVTEENTRLGVEVVTEDVSRLQIEGKLKKLTASGIGYTARAVVVATGARLKRLDVEGAARLTDRGVSQCAWCNGSLHRDEGVFVIGGGDSALQEALHLAKYVSSVTIVTRGEALRARASLVDRAVGNERIAFRWETDVAEVLGDDRVSAVRLRDRSTGDVEVLPAAGVFVYVGLAPNVSWLEGQVALDPDGHIVTDEALRSSLAGGYAAGAVHSGYRGRLTHAVGEATTAAIAAAHDARD